MRIAVDLDDVMAEFVPEVLRRWNADPDDSLPEVKVEDITTWSALWEKTAGDAEVLWNWITRNHPTIYRDLPWHQEAGDAVDALAQDHDILFVTSRRPGYAADTVEWLGLSDFTEPHVSLHFTNDKASIEADVYIEDAPHHLKAIVEKRPDALVLRWKRPWNTDSPGVPVDSWAQVMELVEQHEATLREPSYIKRLTSYGATTGKAEVRQTSDSGGQKGIKLEQLGAIDPLALQVLGQVAGFGAQKYDTFNFAKGYPWSWSFNALYRHFLAWLNGEELDPESGLPHLGHAMWHCATLLTFTLRGRGTDDRIGSVLKDGEAA